MPLPRDSCEPLMSLRAVGDHPILVPAGVNLLTAGTGWVREAWAGEAAGLTLSPTSCARGSSHVNTQDRGQAEKAREAENRKVMMTQEREGLPHPIDGVTLGGATEHADVKLVATNASLGRRGDLGKDFVLTGQLLSCKGCH